MDRAIYQRQQLVLRTLVRELRLEQGLSQVELAKQFGKPQSWVSKVESGERRLDLLELRELCHLLGLDTVQVLQRLEERLC